MVDTNPADYFELWHIPTAVNMPYGSMIGDPERAEKMLSTLPKDRLIVLYCLCEEGADSSEVALILRRLGYRRNKVKVLEGGLIKWDEKGYPMIKTEVPE
jgi:rhodanese-related sulfurtransferase